MAHRRLPLASLLAVILLLTACKGDEPAQPGGLPEGVFDSLARTLPSNRPAVTFTEVAQQSGLTFVHSRGERSSMLPEDMGSGAAWGDYDNDGYPDLYLVNQIGPLAELAQPAADAPGNKLYRNQGDGTFVDVTAAAGVGHRGFGMGAFWGDYDNDGCLDLYVTNYGKSLLYHNNCDGTFTDVADRAGVTNNRWAPALFGLTTTATAGSTSTSATTSNSTPRAFPATAPRGSTASTSPSR